MSKHRGHWTYEVIGAVLKSALFLVLGMVVLYKLKVSQSVNDLVEKGKGLLRKSQ